MVETFFGGKKKISWNIMKFTKLNKDLWEEYWLLLNFSFLLLSFKTSFKQNFLLILHYY